MNPRDVRNHAPPDSQGATTSKNRPWILVVHVEIMAEKNGGQPGELSVKIVVFLIHSGILLLGF